MLNVIKERKSVRTYLEKELSEKDLKAVKQIVKKYNETKGFFGHEVKLDLFEKPFKNGLAGSKFIIALIGIFFIGFLPNKLLFIPAYFVYFIYLLEIISDKKMLNISIPMVTVIIILCMIFTTLYNSYTNRFEKDEYSISFNENNEFITTEKCKSNLNYLGETSTNIFLYDIDNKVSKIYNKSKITNLEIQNTNSLDAIILKIRDSYPVKIFREMLNE